MRYSMHHVLAPTTDGKAPVRELRVVGNVEFSTITPRSGINRVQSIIRRHLFWGNVITTTMFYVELLHAFYEASGNFKRTLSWFLECTKVPL